MWSDSVLLDPPPPATGPAVSGRTHEEPLGAGLSANILSGKGPLAAFLRENPLHAVFQPIIKLDGGQTHAHEALVRGPAGSPFEFPDTLFNAAQREGLTADLERLCMATALRCWSRQQQAGRLFVNVSAQVLIAIWQERGREALASYLINLGLMPRMLVLEITEHERVADMDELAAVVAEVHAAGISLALDDFGDGRSSLRLWSQLKPEIVKTDKYFTKDVSSNADKLKTLQALQQIAAVFNTELVAEGVETLDDLRVLRDLGIHYGQGYLLGRPNISGEHRLAPEALDALMDRRVAVFPELSRRIYGGQLRSVAVQKAPTVTAQTTIDETAKLFLAHPELHAMALLEGERPIGILNRQLFMNEYAKPYYREVWGRKSCLAHANLEPRVIEREHDVDQLIGILTSQDQRYLNDGFIVTENGRYTGLGSGDQLVRSVTETRIEAARHANPLTFLPGNIPLTQHIERLLKSGAHFVACYADLNHFKPFNDRYGYWRGDEMLRLLSRTAVEHCDQRRDFVGHVGGDDFVILFQSDDWRERCERMVAGFNELARQLFDDEAQTAGGFHAEDRYGATRFFPLTTLSIGAVRVEGLRPRSAEQIASQAARVKHVAKSTGSGLVVRNAGTAA
jgi:diguanylate cyclase (GGDEF)-like protein